MGHHYAIWVSDLIFYWPPKKKFGPHFRHCIYMLVIPIKYVYANKIDRHDITETLVKVALNTIKATYYIIIYSYPFDNMSFFNQYF